MALDLTKYNRHLEMHGLARHLIDFDKDRPLHGQDVVPIQEYIWNARVMLYTHVPFFHLFDQMMDVHPTVFSDPEKYAHRREELFESIPQTNALYDSLIYTQPGVNRRAVTELVNGKLDRYVDIPVLIVWYNHQFYLMDGHHRTVAHYIKEEWSIPAKVLDLGVSR